MLARSYCICVFFVTVFCVNGQMFDMSGAFQRMNGQMQNAFSQMQNNFKNMKPWYYGPNVCMDEKFLPGGGGGNQCMGDNMRYSCMSTVMNNGVAMQKVTTYECCMGFRRASGPGCIAAG